ncbi:DUF6325 family protein [Actinocatenispora sera]|uniref:DUF1269 domain-containing protein n=1 Tax=Actinocatenispora sera TaxID=390989 RepID=A0A810L1K7_9ACTN|nr:DUF6325 family protein [Actinocatenispora sera]BCJ28346.1 hypothetical protein Asera_24540 [Actinocatenispora sera]
MGRGPMEFVVVEFPTTTIDQQLARELREVVASGLVRVVDAMVIRRDEAGTVTVQEFADLGPETTRPYADVVGTIEGLIADEDAADIATRVQPGTSALVVLLEHLWLSGLAGAMAAAGGRVVFTERIPAPVVDQVLAERAAS